MYSSWWDLCGSGDRRWVSWATALNSQVISIPTASSTWDIARTFVMHLGYIVVSWKMEWISQATKVIKILQTDEFPTILFDVVKVASVSRESVTMTSRVDTPSAELLCLFVGQIPMVSLIQHTIGEGASRANRKEIAFETRSIWINIEDGRALREFQNDFLQFRLNSLTVLSQPQIIVPWKKNKHPIFGRMKTSEPCWDPFLCNCIRDYLGTCWLPILKCVHGFGVHAIGSASQGMSPSTGSQLYPSVS